MAKMETGIFYYKVDGGIVNAGKWPEIEEKWFCTLHFFRKYRGIRHLKWKLF